MKEIAHPMVHSSNAQPPHPTIPVPQQSGLEQTEAKGQESAQIQVLEPSSCVA